jgi:hypothetical protein
VRKCKQKSVHLDVVLPHQRVLAKNSWEFSRSIFSVLLVGSVLASGTLRWLTHNESFAVLANFRIDLHGNWESFLALVAITIGFAALAFAASGTKRFEEWIQNFAYAGYAYLPMAFFGLFNIYFRQFIVQGYEIPGLLAELLGFTNVLNPLQVTPSLVALHAIPPVLALAGCVLSLYLLRKLREKYALPACSYWLHQLIIAATCLVFLIIL